MSSIFRDLPVMYYGNEDESVKDVVKEVVDLICTVVNSESLESDTVVTTNEYEDAKVRDRFC